jgi:hypothetical protein
LCFLSFIDDWGLGHVKVLWCWYEITLLSSLQDMAEQGMVAWPAGAEPAPPAPSVPQDKAWRHVTVNPIASPTAGDKGKGASPFDGAGRSHSWEAGDE